MRWRYKLKQIHADGPDRLLVVSDWDRTLTRSTGEDGSDQSTCSVIANSGHLGQAFNRRYQELFERYRKIERAIDLPERVKSPHFLRWWSRQFDLLLDYKFSTQTIHRIVSENRPHLRDGARLFLKPSTIAAYPLSFCPRASRKSSKPDSPQMAYPPPMPSSSRTRWSLTRTVLRWRTRRRSSTV
jgi:5'-nucleotidase